MSDIRNQLIKDSYNYVLQSDLSTGVVYRIGGDIPFNPIFQSGLTVGGGFTYSGAGEQVGYVMTCDALGNATWSPVSAATPSSGVTSITVGNGLSANTSTGAVTIVFTGTSGLAYYVTGSTPTGVSLISGDRWFDTTTGAEVVYINDGDSKQWIQPNNAAQSSSPVSYYTASTYSAMISFGTPTNMTIIKVLNDENKSVSNAIYQVWPDGVRIWMAAIQDN